ncbi:MAG: globin family protein [Cyanobacteria bacterium P01_H01_bin.15]
MSSLQVELLEQSFGVVKPRAEEFAASFYDNLFTMYPDAKPLFATTDIKEQQKKLLASLVLVVNNLRNPDALGEPLRGLGARHVKYGALPEHYPLVGNALLTTFEQFLGEAWTAETKTAWADAYGIITEIMLDGADYDEDTVKLDAAQPDAPAEPDATEIAPMPSEEVDPVTLIEESFAQVAPKADEFAESFYETLFTNYPDAKPLFETTDFAAQRKKLVASLVLVVENIRKPDVLSKALKGLGARHVKYGALPEHYPLVGNSLLLTLEKYLGGGWTPAVKEAWVGAYEQITELMLEGADYSNETVELEAAPPAVETATPEEEDDSIPALLEKSFEKVKPKASEFVISFYENLFSLHGDVTPLFKKANMQGQAQKLLEALVFVVEHVREPEVLSKTLKGLGAKHVKYGALPEHYPMVGSALLVTFEQYLGSDWTPKVQEAWTTAYGQITELMLEGADYSKSDVQLKEAESTASAKDSAAAAQSSVAALKEETVNWPLFGGLFGGAGIGIILLLILL